MAGVLEIFDRFMGREDVLSGVTAAEKARVRAHQLFVVRRMSVSMLVANILNATLVMLQYTLTGTYSVGVAAWTLLMYALAGTTIWRTVRKGPVVARETASENGIRKSVIGAFILGAMWGVFVLAFYPGAPVGAQVVAIAIIGGMMGGGCLALHYIPSAMRAYVLAIAIGGFGALLIDGQMSGIALGGLLVVYTVGLLRAGFGVGDTFLRSKLATMQIDEQSQTIGLLLKDFQDNARDWLWELDETGWMVRGVTHFSNAAHLPEKLIERLFDKDGGSRPLQPGLIGLRKLVDEGKTCADVEIWLQVDEKVRWFRVSGKPTGSGGYRGVASDITDEKQAEQRINQLAHTDMLTGLVNRVHFAALANRKLDEAKRNGLELGIFCLDMDGFKPVNDTMGHQTGDEVLRHVGQRLKAFAKQDDIVARMGGDEFVFVTGRMVSETDMATFARSLISAVSAPYRFRDTEVRVGMSVGMARGVRDGDTLDVLMHNADLALYRAKESGRGHAIMFEPDMDKVVAAKRRLKQDLRTALANNEMHLEFQPLLDVDSRKVSGFEALMRWNHPERGPVSPMEFIPAAEESGLIKELGTWSISEACRHAALWPEEISVAVNLSPVQFAAGNVAEIVEAALAEHGLTPSRLEIEITESLFIENTEVVLSQLQALKALGVSVAIDDFGTGYSSLSYLMRFPFDKLKIDKAFISNLSSDQVSRGILRAIADLGEVLNLRVVAEGVESLDQAEFLSDVSCAQMQGFLFSQPIRAELIAPYLLRMQAEALQNAKGRAATQEGKVLELKA